MTSFSMFKAFIFFNFMIYVTVCNRDPLLAFTGCNATLQWNLYNSSYKQEQTDIRIFDKAGYVIAKTGNNQCLSQHNHSQSCIISNKNEDLVILLTLTNITTNHTGNYTIWLRQDLHVENKTLALIVIDKPQIMEVSKPVLYESFSIMCTTSYTSDCITYYWKINGSDLQDSISIHASMSTLTYKNVTMMDNFSRLTCRSGIEKCSNILCNSSEDSYPYTVEPYYGPMHVSLTLNESHIYLEENTTFKVQCLAKCYPACAFRWESYYINVDNEKLVINRFNERLSGAYTCTATNRKTGVTAKSDPIFLHHAKVSLAPGVSQGLSPEQYWKGPITASVFPLIVGFILLIKYWRKIASRTDDSERSCKKCSKRVSSANKNSLEKQFPKVDESTTCATEDHCTCTRSHDPTTSCEHPGPNLQEEKCSTIDEGVMSVYDYTRDNVISGNSHDTASITEHDLYDYASPIETCRVEVADIHVTFENYITPVHGPISPTEMCASGDINLLGSDRIDITTSSEPVHSINDIKVHDSELSYITPII
ncbi:hypothetical protein ACJMK2_026311 [Sinanodonta woodiana]|uniref:Ig-like domain-containing protein n=1 Tax=Sinanodonta woodiana TaxID=1069815 RepID=A0ABD3XJ76_SINWO